MAEPRMTDFQVQESDKAPIVGQWWRHPRYRDAWRVEKVGRKYVYLRGQTPGIPDARVDLVMWPGRWEAVDG